MLVFDCLRVEKGVFFVVLKCEFQLVKQQSRHIIMNNQGFKICQLILNDLNIFSFSANSEFSNSLIFSLICSCLSLYLKIAL